jgi:hypothetical protein
MTSKEEDRLIMFLTLCRYLVNHPEITIKLPNFATNFQIFNNAVLDIQKNAEEQKFSMKGITQVKNQLKEDLTVLTADYVRKLGAYAKFNHNTPLADEVSVSESKLRQMADAVIKTYSQQIYNLTQPLVAQLAEYGIDAEMQTKLAGLIEAYNQSLGTPGVERSESAQLTKQRNTLFATAEGALENMDTAVEIVKVTEVDFYNGYKSARKVIERGAGTLAVKGIVIDAQTGAAIKGVSVSFCIDGKTDVVLEKKTADKGGFTVKNLAAGMYKVCFKKNGYAEHTEIVVVNSREMTDLKISLQKA